MTSHRPLRALLLSLACSAALAAQAQTATITLDIPAGDLASALDAYSRQSGTQLVYRADQLKGARSAGVRGAVSSQRGPDQPLNQVPFSMLAPGAKALEKVLARYR